MTALSIALCSVELSPGSCAIAAAPVRFIWISGRLMKCACMAPTTGSVSSICVRTATTFPVTWIPFTPARHARAQFRKRPWEERAAHRATGREFPCQS